MRATVTVTDLVPDFNERVARAQQAGMISVAQLAINAVKRNLRGGYTSGAFVTGNVLNSVTRSDPYRNPFGEGWTIEIGSDVPYALFWEVGHHNLFTRRFEREERWVPAIESVQEQMGAAYARAFRRNMESGAAVGGGEGLGAAGGRTATSDIDIGSGE